ncbi:DUF6993 domain-containing protein [Microbacterium sulfonylureivorans]|uniref:DUF6993 domain-containing protein n=1 Tax=Microbacterium sulfonylureivorans TaxID=2486854 RepID=UPI001F0BF53A|nr:hypothetical protein [Microbacterium sulfonylureivorans]
MARHPERIASPPIAAAALRVTAISLVLVGLGVLAGCAGPVSPTGSPSATATTTSPVASDGPTPSSSPSATEGSDPVLVPEGTAADNLAVFAAITEAVWASADRAAGRAYVDALVAAGFDKAAMQVTADTSTVGNPAESIQFSVRWGDECLVGQVGPATGDPVAVVVPVLDEGRCLVGATRPIDW